jgi:hypothetical protein
VTVTWPVAREETGPGGPGEVRRDGTSLAWRHDAPDAPPLGWVAVCTCCWVGRSATRPGAVVWRDWHPQHTDVAGDHVVMVIAVRPRTVAEVPR